LKEDFYQYVSVVKGVRKFKEQSVNNCTGKTNYVRLIHLFCVVTNAFANN